MTTRETIYSATYGSSSPVEYKRMIDSYRPDVKALLRGSYNVQHEQLYSRVSKYWQLLRGNKRHTNTFQDTTRRQEKLDPMRKRV